MSFGEGLNDLSMIKAARYSVAMANAVDEGKAAAKFVTATNDEDGVALAIEKAMAEGLM
jgi:hydroxymethylpyrimidine pyrophosphatase-like HAD family hydrolase